MYSKSAWGGPVDPHILVKFTDVGRDVGDDPIVSLLMFDWADADYIGIMAPGESKKLALCEPKTVEAGLCNTTNIGEYILAPDYEKSTNIILTKAIHLNNTKAIKYDITKTGYFCVLTDRYTAEKYEVIVEFRNAYGELPASQIPKLPFYGGITILYALVLVFWGFLYFQHRSDILAVQNYITAILIFLVPEMLLTWGFYDYQNRNGANIGSKVLLTVVSVLNAIRNSFSFFLLLIVCMGYGVVKLSLGGLMKWVRILAVTHFVFGVVYAVASLTVTPDTAGPIVLFVILPLAATLTAFYVWTLNSLKLTMKELEERKQHTKGLMYRRLWWVLLTSIFVIFAFFFLNSLTFAGHGTPDFAPTHWKTRWFVLDGWLNLVYLADICAVAYLWRPTENNRRFAMSDELAQDDDGGFEIASIGGSALDEDSEDEDEAVKAKRDKDLERGEGGDLGRAGESSFGTGASSSQPPQRHRASVDEPIFEVGDDDGAWTSPEVSDDEDEDRKKDGEGERLVNKGKKGD